MSRPIFNMCMSRNWFFTFFMQFKVVFRNFYFKNEAAKCSEKYTKPYQAYLFHRKWYFQLLSPKHSICKF